jgi:hypothetical protein
MAKEVRSYCLKAKTKTGTSGMAQVVEHMYKALGLIFSTTKRK